MDNLIGVLLFLWVAGTIITALGCVLVFFLAGADARNLSRSARRKECARAALWGVVLFPFAWAWPLGLGWFFVAEIKKLMKIAEVPSWSERRAVKQARRIAELENDKREMKATILKLEQETGISQ